MLEKVLLSGVLVSMADGGRRRAGAHSAGSSTQRSFKRVMLTA
jgi:hypothetical protein